MNREELLAYMDEYLKIDEIEDYGPQGLQVEAENSTIDRIALSVDTAPSVIEAYRPPGPPRAHALEGKHEFVFCPSGSRCPSRCRQ
ncbi:MAG: hypothetical protein AMJ56_19765 [Anaerolineae bacterium SG8_19]|nr:MAG: hypothetical protein AMJ56_19765 [Anaerolineae bacterium SG8_19]